jgi:hypothetical protein
VSQEIIDVFAVFNALRAAIRPKELTDFEPVASSVPSRSLAASTKPE